MDKFSGQKRAAQFLFQSIDPFDSMMLDVGGVMKFTLRDAATLKANL